MLRCPERVSSPAVKWKVSRHRAIPLFLLYTTLFILKTKCIEVPPTAHIYIYIWCIFCILCCVPWHIAYIFLCEMCILYAYVCMSVVYCLRECHPTKSHSYKADSDSDIELFQMGYFEKSLKIHILLLLLLNNSSPTKILFGRPCILKYWVYNLCNVTCSLCWNVINVLSF